MHGQRERLKRENNLNLITELEKQKRKHSCGCVFLIIRTYVYNGKKQKRKLFINGIRINISVIIGFNIFKRDQGLIFFCVGDM